MGNDEWAKTADRCNSELNEFFHLAMEAVCKTDEEIQAALADFQITQKHNVAFHTSKPLHKASLKMAAAIVDALGTDRAGIKELREAGYTALSALLQEQDDWDEKDLYEKFRRNIFEVALVYYQYVAPCNFFEFKDTEPYLECGPIRVMTSEHFVEEASIPKQGENWKLLPSEEPWPDRPKHDGNFYVYGRVWNIKCDSPKELAPQSARWLAEVFISLLRLGVRPVDYCLRAGTGKVEPTPFSANRSPSKQIIYNEQRLNIGGSDFFRQYSIDEGMKKRIAGETFQSIVQDTLSASRNTLGERLAHGLGWLTRSRQASDTSVRLLYSFTALEALFSEQSAFSPVADSISRLASVVLSDNVEHRQETYSEIKKLYSLRSDLVHRGRRNVHWLNANNIQSISETVYALVLEKADLKENHQQFLAGLKKASHGGKWP